MGGEVARACVADARHRRRADDGSREPEAQRGEPAAASGEREPGARGKQAAQDDEPRRSSQVPVSARESAKEPARREDKARRQAEERRGDVHVQRGQPDGLVRDGQSLEDEVVQVVAEEVGSAGPGDEGRAPPHRGEESSCEVTHRPAV